MGAIRGAAAKATVVCMACSILYFVTGVRFFSFFLEGGVGLSRQTINVCVRVFFGGEVVEGWIRFNRRSMCVRVRLF